MDSRFQTEYKRLNNKQKEAVDHIYGPVMVVAGPGTGKTQIIASRTANIIEKAQVNPENIFITTFTEAGVIAIRKRLIQFLGNEAYKVNVATIHSFSQEVIKTFPEKFIEYKASTAIDEVDNLEILKKIIDSLIAENKLEVLTSDYDTYYYLRTIKSKIGTLKQEGVTKSAFKVAIEKQRQDFADELSEIKPTLKKYEKTKEKHEKEIKKLQELTLLFEGYNAYLREHGLYDFNDMINFVLEKFRNDEELIYHYSEKFQFIMLDEYQDTNNAQNQIIELILNGHSELDSGGHYQDSEPNVMAVGDDDQSIYRFQGANIENMLEFSTNYKNTNFIVLENNYRSTPAILEASQKLIQNNNERLSNKINIEKKLISSSDLQHSIETVKLFTANSDLSEKAFIIQKIQDLTTNQEIEKKEIAIIVRSNREVEEYTTLLLQNNIEADSKLKTNILESVYVEYILHFLELISDPFSSEKKLIDILLADITGLNKLDIFKLNRVLYIQNYSKKFKVSFLDFLNELEQKTEEEQAQYGLQDLASLLEFRNSLLDLQSELSTLGLKEFMSVFIEKIGLLEYIETQKSFDDLQDVYTFFNTVTGFIERNNSLSLEQLLEKIQLYKEYNFIIPRQILKENKTGVQVLTAHSSKGLEYDVVFTPGLYTGNWDNKKTRDLLKLPSYISGQGLQDTSFEQIEEDRRLFFVAITRAKKQLYISYPMGMGTKPLLQSVFLSELTGSYENIEDTIETAGLITQVEQSIKNNLISYDNLEIEYISDFLETYKLSPSDLNAFLEDPMIFLNRVIFKYPFEDNKYTIFGKVYHRTLELFYLKYKKEEKLPEKSYLTSTFRYILQKEAITPEEYENMLEKGITGLEGYYDLYSTKAQTPLVLEYSFRRKNIFFEDIPLTGTVDKMEKTATSPHPTPLPKGEGIASGGQIALFREKVDLIDYKTGKAKSLGVIKGLDRFGNKKDEKGAGNYFRQLLFYKLLCEQDREFGAKFEVGNLALDFVEGKDGNYKYVEVEYSQEEYEEFKQELRKSREKITSMDFWREFLGK